MPFVEALTVGRWSLADFSISNFKRIYKAHHRQRTTVNAISLSSYTLPKKFLMHTSATQEMLHSSNAEGYINIFPKNE
jgi:hypothetical protein